MVYHWFLSDTQILMTVSIFFGFFSRNHFLEGWKGALLFNKGRGVGAPHKETSILIGGLQKIMGWDHTLHVPPLWVTLIIIIIISITISCISIINMIIILLLTWFRALATKEKNCAFCMNWYIKCTGDFGHAVNPSVGSVMAI